MGMQFGDQLVDRLQAERMAMDMRLQMAGNKRLFCFIFYD